jgi:hypothetical protein
MGCTQSSDTLWVDIAKRKVINFDELHEKIKYEVVTVIKKQYFIK